MSFSLVYEHLFELLNFLFLCACIVYGYRRYGAQKLSQAIKAEKDVLQNLKQSVVETQQHVATLEQQIAEQDAYAYMLIAHISIWAQEEERKKAAFAQECMHLKAQFLSYLAAQEKATALSELKRDTSARALAHAREMLVEQYSDAQKQQHALHKAYSHCIKGMNRG